MKIMFGHANMDIDCIGSMVLARYLFPDYQAVKSRFIHPVARNLSNLFEYRLRFLAAEELKGADIESIIVVDTQTRKRVEEYFAYIPGYRGEIHVYDHHVTETCDIPNASTVLCDFGSNTTYFALELAESGTDIHHDDATIALAAIYSDTGSFMHDNVKDADFNAAAYLLQNGASISVVKKLLSPLKEEHQVSLFHRLINEMIYQDFRGHVIGLSYIELEKQAGGLAAVVEKTFEVENIDAIFAIFSMKKENDVLIVARSRKDTIEVNRLMEPFNGGGHPQASSALVKGRSGGEVFREFLQHINSNLNPAVTAGDVMSADVKVLDPDMTLRDASIFLENINHTGAPVVDKAGGLIGILTLRNIMKARRASQMNAPVRAFMTRKVITGTKDMTMRAVESIFYKHNIGHLPILDGGRLVGLVTRTDYLEVIGNVENHRPAAAPSDDAASASDGEIKY